MKRTCFLGRRALIAALALAARVDAYQSPDELMDLDLASLMDVEITVTSAARREQSLEETAAAIYVLTNETIRRSGATSLAEALRLVPGLQVARVTSAQWAISSRGFNDQYANKLLVLIDGRSVYTPLFSGVHWDVQDVVLADVERIEVIRGPGAALWGANAVNGIINVITKPASETQGALVQLGAGNEERALATVRYGGSLGDDASFRVYAKYFERDSLGDPSGGQRPDEWDMGRAGFRSDWAGGERDQWTLQGDVYRGNENDLFFDHATNTAPAQSTDVSGFDLLGRWTRRFDATSDFAVQAYLDGNERNNGVIDEERLVYDVDFQHHFKAAASHDVVWGAALRRSELEMQAKNTNFFLGDEERADHLASLFAQDDITFDDGRWHLILGSKLEHNDFTGVELQPNARALWHVGDDQTLWAAVSRAVRSPSVVEDDGNVLLSVTPGPGFDTHVIVAGDGEIESEDLTAYELGYRRALGERATLDATVFFNDYDNLITVEPGTPVFQGGVLVVPSTFTNSGEAQSWGAEIAVEWACSERTRLHASYSYLDVDVEDDDAASERDPQNQAQLRCTHDLAERWELDGALFYVDRLQSVDVDSYLRLDTRLQWRANDDLSWILGVQGLLHDDEAESGATFTSPPSEVETSIYLGLTWSR